MIERDHAPFEIVAVRALCNVNSTVPIAISALAGLAGVPDDRPGQRSDRPANNRPFHRVAGHCCAYSCATQTTDGSALFGAGACRERYE